MPTLTEYKFVCPECGGNSLMEILNNCIVSVPLEKILVLEEDNSKKTTEVVDAPQNTWDVDPDGSYYYRCEDCGHDLWKITSRELLAEWLLKNGIKKGETE